MCRTHVSVRIAGLSGLAVTLMAADCSIDKPQRYDLKLNISGSPAAAYSFEVGDEPVFVATETDIEIGTGGPFPTSQTAPNDFGWASSDTTVATVSPSGAIRMRRIGAARITVRSVHRDGIFPVYVGPRFGRVVLTPDSANVAVNGTATFSILAYDPNDNLISPDSSRGYLKLVLLTPGVASLTSAPVADQWTATGKTPGATKIFVNVDVWKGARLRDTSILVVR